MAKELNTDKTLDEVAAQYAGGEWGFTGTRAGMKAFQVLITRRALQQGQPLVFRHGGAFGSDFSAHALCRETNPDGLIEVWPADRKRVSLFAGQPSVVIKPLMDPLNRNKEIAKRSEFIIATPHTEKEELRSGTWATIRDAMREAKPVLIIWPASHLITFHLGHTLYRVTT